VTGATLFVRMLRWRVAATLWSFLLIGAAAQGPLRPIVALLFAAVSLSAAYVVATTVNDIADRDVDRINHPRDPGRPLVTGAASERDLWRTNALAAPIALAAAAVAGTPVLAMAAASLAIGYAYSLPPIRLSYRTWLAPAVLAIAYAVVPYAIGLLAAGGRFDRTDVLLCVALSCLFVARIVLKDFRDRAGDELHGRPTLLLRFGKPVTCAASVACLAAGAALLPMALGEPVLVPLVSAFAAAIAWMLHRLLLAPAGREEQVAIGLGARMGNGLLVGVLVWLVLEGEGAPAEQRLLALALVAAAFGAGFLALVRRPEDVVLGYKG
jgi:4-hydroxybenzoate polyprenyltransferase